MDKDKCMAQDTELEVAVSGESLLKAPSSRTSSDATEDGTLIHAKNDASATSNGKRDTWTGRLDFVMSALSFAVGMGNLWRFPYLCYQNGGGAFLIPYVIMVIVLGFPIVYLEFCLGQYGRKGIVDVWKAVPIFKGVGWGMFFLSCFVCIYYNMLIAWCIFYIFASFQKEVPWKSCGNAWNTDSCADSVTQFVKKNCSDHNGTFWNTTCLYPDHPLYSHVTNLSSASQEVDLIVKSPSDEYFHHYMLGMSEGLHDVGGPQWSLALCLLLVWTIIALCLSKGISSAGKASYVTALFPYVVMSILFVRGLTLDGAFEGIVYFIKPDWNALLQAKVWVDAAVQVFFSMSICWGGLITLASYNDFHSNAFRDAAVVAVGDTLTSIFGGLIIFSYLGYMAKQMSVDVSEVATQGSGLAFIVYPEAVTLLPVSQLWNVLFMLVLVNVGFGTSFGIVQTVHSTLIDMIPRLKTGRKPLLVLILICFSFFALALPMTTRGGIYILQVMDNYAATYGVLFFGFTMMVAIGWVYGGQFNWKGMELLSKNIDEMLGSRPSVLLILCWKYICPMVILVIMIFNVVAFKATSYGDYVVPPQYEFFGWLMLAVEILCVPVTAMALLCSGDKKQSVMQKLKLLCRPAEDWTSEDSSLDNKASSVLYQSANSA